MAVHSPLSDGYYPAKMRRARVNRSGAGFGAHLIVNHLMVASNTPTRAEDLGRNYFSDPRDDKGRQVYASTHNGCDQNSIAQYVPDDECAYGSHGNDRALHMEHPGMNDPTTDWDEWTEIATLDRSARWAADACRRHGIPPVWLDVDGLADAWGRPGPIGITDHWTVTQVLAAGKGHTDRFPTGGAAGVPNIVAAYMGRVARYHADPAARPVLVLGDHSGKNSLGASKGRPERGDIAATGAPADLQRGLIAAGYDLGPYGPSGKGDDGVLGASTFAGVALYRAALGLPSEPVVNDTVWAAIDGNATTAPPPTPPEPAPLLPPASAPVDRLGTAERYLALALSEIRDELAAR